MNYKEIHSYSRCHAYRQLVIYQIVVKTAIYKKLHKKLQNHKKLQFSSTIPNRRQYQSMFELQNYLFISINIVKVYIATSHLGSCIPRNLQTPVIFSSDVFLTSITQKEKRAIHASFSSLFWVVVRFGF